MELRDFDVFVIAAYTPPGAPVTPPGDRCAHYNGTLKDRAELDCDPEKHGRYVVVKVPGVEKMLALCEVIVIGEDTNSKHQ